MTPLIAILTDFGHHDPYVGVMKGVIYRQCPQARTVDLTHLIPPQDIVRASFHLEQSVPYFPQRTIFLCVVDPGVGGKRAALVVETDSALFVCPDNGILTRCLPLCGELRQIVELEEPVTASTTFHGRDIFAPAAARLAAGASPQDLGRPLEDLIRLEFPDCSFSEDTLEASVLSIDHFGNVIFDLSARQGWAPLQSGFLFLVEGRRVGFDRTYAAVGVGESLLLWNSENYLELATRNGSAHLEWGLNSGQRVRFERVIS